MNELFDHPQFKSINSISINSNKSRPPSKRKFEISKPSYLGPSNPDKFNRFFANNPKFFDELSNDEKDNIETITLNNLSFVYQNKLNNSIIKTIKYNISKNIEKTQNSLKVNKNISRFNQLHIKSEGGSNSG